MSFSLFTAGLAIFAPIVAAYTKPVGNDPVGNAFSAPGLNTVVPAGTPFTITWAPSTQGKIDLVLLKGPSDNAVPQYAIAEGVENTGSYVWTPSNDLEPTGNAGYGIQLIVESNGQYQYTTQFGISNPAYKASSSASTTGSASASAIIGGYGTGINSYFSHSGWTSATGSWSATTTAAANVTVAHHNTTAIAPVTTSTASYGIPVNSTIVKPTGSLTVPSSLKTSATSTAKTGSTGASSTNSGPSATSSGPVQTGAANNMAASFAGLVFAAGVAVFAL